MLKSMQDAFQLYIKDHASDKLLLEHIMDARPNKQTRLAIYHNAYRLRLLESLRADFPKLFLLLGDDYFNTLGLAYLEQHPSTHFSVDRFGAKFPGFLKTYPNLHKAVYELSQFEWSLGEVIIAADADSIDKSVLLQCDPADWPEIQCSLHPSVTWHSFEWQPMVIWNHLHYQPEEDTVPAPVQTPQTLCLFWRKNLQAYFRSIPLHEWVAFEAMAQEKTFSEICEALCGYLSEEQIAAQFSQFLNQWLQDGLIQELS